ncbi:MAG: transposase [Bacillota bacterium]|nr:transposase [Bacillota bacterium]
MPARCFELEEPIRGVLERNDYLDKSKPKINWGDAEEKRALVEPLVKDARRVVEVVSGLGGVREELKQAVGLLRGVAEQDIEGRDGKIQIKRRVTKDRVISITDPEMRHGHKTASKRAAGYKGKVMVCGATNDFIGAVDVVPANEPDNTGLCELIDEQEGHGVRVTKLRGDTSFGDRDTREEMEQRGIDLTAKLPPEKNREGYFSKDDFELNLEEMYPRCPAGQVTYKTRKARDHRGRRIRVFVFDNEVCSACPMRASA